MKAELEQHLALLLQGLNIDHTTIRHVAGKLNRYAEVLQSGRLHLRYWWLYQKFCNKLHSLSRTQLIADTKWWIDVVTTWGGGDLTGHEYPIFSADELLQKKKMCIVLSDASGPDGFGYVNGYLEDDHPRYVSHAWDDAYQFVNSHYGELQALLHFIRETELRGIVILWVSDCLSAVWSVNKGRCHDELALELISNILHLCDEYKLLLVALWVPREMNEFQDYLSHLSMYLNRDEVRGFVGDLAVSDGHRSGDGRSEAEQGSIQRSGEVPSLVSSGVNGAFPSNVQINSEFSMSARYEQPRVDEVHGECEISSKDALPKPADSMVGSDGSTQLAQSRTKASVQRHDGRSKKESSSAVSSGSNHRALGSSSSIVAAACTDVLSGAQWSAKKRRAAIRHSSGGYPVGARAQRF